jgi:hypothetical protein
MENKRLSDNFWLKEFFVSSTHPAYANKLFDNCSQHQVDQLVTLAREMERVRAYAYTKVADPRITITRGYQDAYLNRKVGGVKLSYHQRNIAVDFKMTVPKYNYILPVLWRWMQTNVPISELGLYETEGVDFTNIHYALPTVEKQDVIWHKVRTPNGLVNKDEYV